MRTELDVVNAALVMLGEAPLLGLSQSGDVADACRVALPAAISDVVASHTWPWAERSSRIYALDPQPSNSVYAARGMTCWALPGDLIRLNSVWIDAQRNVDHWERDRFGLWIEAPASANVWVVYTGPVPFEAIPEDVLEAIEASLAYRLALALREDTRLAEFLYQRRNVALALARHRSATQRPTKHLPMRGPLSRR